MLLIPLQAAGRLLAFLLPIKKNKKKGFPTVKEFHGSETQKTPPIHCKTRQQNHMQFH